MAAVRELGAGGINDHEPSHDLVPMCAPLGQRALMRLQYLLCDTRIEAAVGRLRRSPGRGRWSEPAKLCGERREPRLLWPR